MFRLDLDRGHPLNQVVIKFPISTILLRVLCIESASLNFHNVEFRSCMVVTVAGKRLNQRPIECNDRRVRDENIPKFIKAAVETVVGRREIVEGMVENFTEKRRERRPEPPVEGGIRESAVTTDELEVALSERFERTVLVHSESERKRPEQRGGIEFPTAFDESGFASEFTQPLFRKRSRKPVFNHRIRWTVHHESTDDGLYRWKLDPQ